FFCFDLRCRGTGAWPRDGPCVFGILRPGGAAMDAGSAAGGARPCPAIVDLPGGASRRLSPVRLPPVVCRVHPFALVDRTFLDFWRYSGGVGCRAAVLRRRMAARPLFFRAPATEAGA